MTQAMLPFPDIETLPPITLADIEALAAWEALRRQKARYCMYAEKHMVAASLGLSFADVNLPWGQWLELWLWWRDGEVPY